MNITIQKLNRNVFLLSRRCVVPACAVIAMLTVIGCGSSGQSGAAIGAGAGALGGQVIGGDTEGTLIGAGAGAIGGYIIGNEMDKNRAEEERQRDRYYDDRY